LQSAECNPAIQQIANLRYGDALGRRRSYSIFASCSTGVCWRQLGGTPIELML